MNFAIQTEAPLGDELNRIHYELITETVALIRPPLDEVHESIHNARKSVKFLRALVRLLQNPLGPDRYSDYNLGYRDSGRMISELRDLHVMIIITRYVSREAHSVRRQDVEEGITYLEKRERALLDQARRENRFEQIVTKLELFRDRFASDIEAEIAFPQLLPGLKSVYVQGRKKYELAAVEDSGGQFHELRKQAKYLLHCFQVLSNYWPQNLDITGTSLQQLSDYLGEEHDLALFDQLLHDDAFGSRIQRGNALSSFTTQKRAHLQRSALNLAQFVYAKPPEEFIAFFENLDQEHPDQRDDVESA
ncbi:MAG: CHAD domain-containing protein [Balneolaceae bacterium]|nr:CHAD domain-containing protein [Balneolaceae bacterium]